MDYDNRKAAAPPIEWLWRFYCGDKWRLKLLTLTARESGEVPVGAYDWLKFNVEDFLVGILVFKDSEHQVTVIDTIIQPHVIAGDDDNKEDVACSAQCVIKQVYLDLDAPRCSIRLGDFTEVATMLDYYARQSIYGKGGTVPMTVQIHADEIYTGKTLPSERKQRFWPMKVDLIDESRDNGFYASTARIITSSGRDPLVYLSADEEKFQSWSEIYHVLEDRQVVWVSGKMFCSISSELDKRSRGISPKCDLILAKYDTVFHIGSHILPRRDTGIRHACPVQKRLGYHITCVCCIAVDNLNARCLFIESNAAPALDFLPIKGLLAVSLTCKTWFKRIWTAKFRARAKTIIIEKSTELMMSHWRVRRENVLTKWERDKTRQERLGNAIDRWPDEYVARWLAIYMTNINDRWPIAPLWDGNTLCSIWRFSPEQMDEIPPSHYWSTQSDGDIVFREYDLLWARTRMPWLNTDDVKADKKMITAFNRLPDQIKRRFQPWILDDTSTVISYVGETRLFDLDPEETMPSGGKGSVQKKTRRSWKERTNHNSFA